MLGSLWAAVEIVLGSFLHNLRLPFAGSVLAAFGVVVMTAGQRSWPERGVIWRSALICALMKSISPSAVILGPMVGIATEGLLLQACVTLLGSNPAGYLVGGALAVSWSLVQKIVSALITFGPDLVRLYVEAYGYASRSLGVSRFGPFDLVATLFVLECLTGMAAALAGMRLARSARTVPAAGDGVRPAAPARVETPGAIHATGAWSIPRLAAFAAALVGGMALLGHLPIPAAAAYVAVYAALVVRTYPRAVGRLRRPWFWVQVVGVLLLASLLLGGLHGGAAGLLEGFRAGAQMALRATLVLLGFTAVSVELRNPRILAWLERRRLRGLSDALGLAFGALPAFTAALADQRAFWRHPFVALGRMMQVANSAHLWREARHTGVVILTGEIGAGKTTRAGEVVDALRRRGATVAGILARRAFADARHQGFDLVDLSTGRTVPLCREGGPGGRGEEQWGRFAFIHDGLRLGREALAMDGQPADVVVVDEVGPLELSGGGWADPLDNLLSRFDGPVLLVARPAVVEAVRTRWGAAGTPVCDVSRDGPDRIADVLLDRLARDGSAPAYPPSATTPAG